MSEYLQRFDRWMEELRTTTAPQSQGFLRDKYGYCCLGILCELENVRSAPSSLEEVNEYDFSYLPKLPPSNHKLVYLPPVAAIRVWFGLSDDLAERLLQVASDMNDRDGAPFAQIAERLSNNFRRLIPTDLTT